MLAFVTVADYVFFPARPDSGGRPDDLAGVEELREIITTTGAREHAEHLIASLLETSLIAIETDIINPEARAIFTELAHAATKRSG